MSFNPDPVTLINLTFCVIIVILSGWWSRKTGSSSPLFIGTAFGLFGISHFITLAGLSIALNNFLVIVRTLAYAVVVIGLYVITTDSLKRRRAEKIVHESDARYRSLCEDVPVALYRTTPSGEILDINPAGIHMFGYPDRNALLTAVSPDLYVDGNARKQWQALIEREDTVRDFEVQFYRLDKSIMWVRNTAKAVRDDQGRIVCYEGYLEDITGRKAAEEELLRRNDELQASYEQLTANEEELRTNFEDLTRSEQKFRESEQRLADIINFLPDATFAIDGTGKIIFWNKALEEMTDSAAVNMLGKGDHEYAIPFYGERKPILIDMIFENTDRIESQYVNVIRRGNILVAEAFVPGIHKGKGASLWAIASPLYDNNGKIIGAIESVRDITEWKMAQDALNRTTKKLNLLNSIAFSDIQNAVFSLSGYMELGKSIVQDEKLQLYLEKETRIIRTITDSLKFVSNYQNLGLKPPAWQNVKQSFLFGTSHLDISKLSRKFAVEGLEIYADPLLEDVFFELAENVVVHGKTATEIAMRYYESPDALTLVFEDNGTGIAVDMKEKVFDRRHEEKRGMGLYLVREILSITGITIEETGEPGKGAQFVIRVPKGGYRVATEEKLS